jgi:hypothetical protein
MTVYLYDIKGYHINFSASVAQSQFHTPKNLILSEYVAPEYFFFTPLLCLMQTCYQNEWASDTSNHIFIPSPRYQP